MRDMDTVIARQIHRTPLRPERVEWACGINGCTGMMEWTGYSQSAFHTDYLHKCTICSRNELARDEKFPHINYVEVDAEIHVEKEGFYPTTFRTAKP